MKWRDETPLTDALRAEIERASGGKVQLAGEVIVGAGKTRATLRGGELILVSVTVPGDSLAALLALRDRAYSLPLRRVGRVDCLDELHTESPSRGHAGDGLRATMT